MRVMKNDKSLFATIAALSLSLVTLVAQQQTRPRPVHQQPENPTWGAQTREEKRKLREIRERDGLEAAAKLYGGFVESVQFDYEMDVDLDYMADVSALAVQGLVKRNQSLIVRAPEVPGYPVLVETIMTDYTLQVLEVYKGDLRLLGRDFTFRIPGGRLYLEGGLWAEIDTPGFAPPMNQDEFILFLDPIESEPNVYSVTFGRQGVFDVRPGGRVHPRARAVSGLTKNTRPDHREFIKQLREAVAKARRGSPFDRQLTGGH
jgi:hypothetical protein